jgi:UDP-N-acetylmuramoylalanine--D-glutamate ligase
MTEPEAAMTAKNGAYLKGKRVVVVGMGASGVAAANLALNHGAVVTACDDLPLASLSDAARALAQRGVTFRPVEQSKYHGVDLIVVSPGVPRRLELDEAIASGVAVIGEVELAVSCLPRETPYAAVGGTNGKSTTTSLLGAILEADEKRVFIGGNLGEPLANHVDDQPAYDAVVLEVSSFQMERVDAFHPRAAILLNVTPDHLDRYDSLASYAAAKGNMFLRQTEADVAIVPVNDPVCLAEAKRGQGTIVTFGPGGDLDLDDEKLTDRRDGETYLLADLLLAGRHNAANLAATVGAARAMGASPAAIRTTMKTFRALPHRTERVAEIAGVRFYDDSKGTNVGAVVTALDGLYEPRCVLVAGGRDKGGSYQPLVDALARRGRAAVLIGEAADAIATAVGDVVPVVRASSMDHAVREAARLAQPGDAVLLSPACSSFDMFRDYKERGDAFVRAVHALASGGAS